MAETNLLNFLLNRDNAESAVGAPAYSITKVLATGASVVTPLAALLAAKINSVVFSSAEIVALIIAVLGFLAIVTTADVFARSLAVPRASAVTSAPPAAPADRSDGVLFEFAPVRMGVLHMDGPDPTVQVLAGRGQQLLVAEQGKQLAWVPQSQVTFC